MYINTSDIGIVEHDLEIGPQSVCEGDVILVNGDLGRHGMAIMAVREGLSFESTIESDTAALHRLVASLLDGGVRVRCHSAARLLGSLFLVQLVQRLPDTRIAARKRLDAPLPSDRELLHRRIGGIRFQSVL